MEGMFFSRKKFVLQILDNLGFLRVVFDSVIYVFCCTKNYAYLSKSQDLEFEFEEFLQYKNQNKDKSRSDFQTLIESSDDFKRIRAFRSRIVAFPESTVEVERAFSLQASVFFFQHKNAATVS